MVRLVAAELEPPMDVPEDSVDVDEDVAALREGLRRRRVLWALGILGNLVVFVALIVGPYFRAQGRAREARHRFSAFVACLYGGQAVPNPGLVLPDGEGEAFAAMAWATEGSWPGECRGALDAIVPEEVFFLLPSAQGGEAEARGAVGLVRRELFDVAIEPDVVLPSRPRRALRQLVSALSEWGKHVGVEEGVFSPALVLPNTAVPRPERLPYGAQRGVPAQLWVREASVEMFALDRRGLSWVELRNRGVMNRRLRRPRRARAVHWQGRQPWLLWVQERRCEGERCQQRPFGIAPIADDAVRVPAPMHLSEGPVSDAAEDLGDRMVVQGDSVRVIAGATGQLEVVSYPIPEGLGDDATAPPEEARAMLEASRESPVQRPVGRWSLDGVAVAAFVEDGRVLSLGNGRLELWDGPQREVLGTVPEGAEAAAMQVRGPWLLLHTSEQLWVFRWRQAELRASLALPDDGADWRWHADERRVAIAAAERTRILVRVCAEHCQDHSLEPAPGIDAHLLRRRLPRAPDDVSSRSLESWSLALASDAAVVAVGAEGEQLKVHRLAAGEVSQSRPAPCWSDEEGFCGPPYLASGGGRVVLGAYQEHGDLLVVESQNGHDWSPLVGLR